jgi:hypothetical protein
LSVASTVEAETKPTARSRVTNGCTLPGVDGRSTWVRRLRDLMGLHLSDLGGEEATSEAERSIVRRASTLTVELERLELRFATGARDITPDLRTYLAQTAQDAPQRAGANGVAPHPKAADVGAQTLEPRGDGEQ